ncbi:hypothetical protein NA57DRAFT_80917 [Rhizodiscina lignyota]|uniref:Tom7-domain-containing protein n=1 Tax=Rhizodiscina lignyota TaxID=1504668 RepID=A0A9P4M443_9PEZI|nr:hypothetical protein NA57DRAFT_80917 [Rhizodiscina lignyota]
MQLSEESKERIARIIDVSRVAIHYGYLPLILWLGGWPRGMDTLKAFLDLRFSGNNLFPVSLMMLPIPFDDACVELRLITSRLLSPLA